MVNKKIFTGYKVKPMNSYFPNFLLFFMKISHHGPPFPPPHPLQPVPCAVAPPPPLRSIRSIRSIRFFRFRPSVAASPVCGGAATAPPFHPFHPSRPFLPLPSVRCRPPVAVRPVPCAVALPPPHAGQEVKKLWTGILFQKKGGQVPLPALVKFFIVYLSPLIHI